MLSLISLIMARFCSWLLDHSRWSLSLILLLSAGWLIPLRHLQFDSSSSSFVQANSKQNTYYERIQRIFGNDEILLIMLTSHDLLKRSMLEQIREVTANIERVEGVKRVLSLTNLMDVEGQGDEVKIKPLVPANLETLNLDELRLRIQADPLLEKHIISKDLQSTSILVFLENFERQRALSQGRFVTQRVLEIVDPLRQHAEVFIGGLPEMEFEGTTNMMSDLKLFTPLTLILVVGLLIVSFRSWRGISLPLVAVLIALLWTLGPMALIGRPLTITTLTLPSLLIANGSSYVIHFLAQYYRALLRAYRLQGHTHTPRDKDSFLNAHESSAPLAPLGKQSYRAVLLETINYTHVAILISATTTMAGFGSLVISRIPTIRDFGIFATWGVFLGYFLCMTLVPLLLWHHRIPRLNEVPGQEDSHRYYLMGELGQFDFRRAHWIYGAALLCAVWALWGLYRLQVHTDYLGYFRQSSQIAKASEAFASRLAGLATFSVVIEAQGDRSVLDPEILMTSDSLQGSMGQTAGVDKTLSIIDSLKLLNRAFHSDNPQFYVLPSDPAVIQELVEFAESDPSNLTEEFLSADHRTLRILVRTRIFRSTELRSEFNRIERQGKELFPPDIQVHSTGTLVLMNQTSDSVAEGQVESLLLSTLLISAIVIVLFRSFKVGLLSIIPAGLPVLFFFGLLGWTGTPLNINTSVIANISIGIAVDNCIHYLIHFRRHRVRRKLTVPDAMREALMSAGGAMISSAIALTFGFLIFGASRFVPVSQFGLLSASVMGANLIATIFLLPALILLLGRATLKKIDMTEKVCEEL
ncbi:MAG TPA: MMPL family transporter [Desulfomonilaceae bacterium]|nr:MMPL family transporter [Desulfomonilaceae bacterium]